MSDDLHDIDRLFREGIEGHEEEVPPSVWEGVNNDLDKKQASYYKSKYYRLKRAAALLLLLCFLGVVYIVYKEAVQDKVKPVVQKKTAPSSTSEPETTSTRSNTNSPVTNSITPLSETVANTNEKNAGNTASVAEERGKPKDTKPTPQQHNATGLNNALKGPQTEEKQFEKSTVNKEGKTVLQTNNHLTREGTATFVTRPTRVQKGKVARLTNTETIAFSKGRKQPSSIGYNNDYSNSTNVLSPASSSYTVTPVAGRNFEVPFVSLQALSASNKSILPATPLITKNKSNTTAHGFSLSAFAAPNMIFDRLEDNDHLAGPGRDRQTARRQEQENFSFSAGLLFSYNAGKKLSLQSGVTITSSSTAIAPSTVYAKPDANGRTRYELHCSSGYAYITPKGIAQPAVNDSAKTSGTVSKLTYITVPALVSYRVDVGRFSFYPTVGAGINILASGKTKTSLSNANGSEDATTTISGLKPTYVDGHFGIGVEYNLTKKISLGLRPNARIALTPINKETPVQSYQNYLSVETGVRIKL